MEIGPLTSFRFFAAIGVVMCHFLTGTDSGFAQDSRLHLVATYGSLGVSFFFILSGYILTYNYAITPEKSQSIDVKSFWWKRFARIYPLYLFALLIDIPINTAHSVGIHGGYGAAIRLIPTFIANALLLQAWCSPFFGGWNPPGWTLSAEAFFYFGFPWLSRKAAWIHSGSWKTATTRCAALLLIGAGALGIVDWEAARLSAKTGQFSELTYFLLRNPPLNTALFGMGILLCLVEKRIRGQGKPASEWLNAVCGMIVAAGFTSIALNHELARGPKTTGACLFFMALIVLGSGEGPVWFSKLLSWSPLMLLGEASYAVYLLQFPLFDYCKQTWIAAGMGRVDPTAQSNLPFYLFYITALVGVSVLVFKMLEQPARRFLQKHQPWSWKPMQTTAQLTVSAPIAVGRQDL
jgi:peptidoglycan/LPS O-acetylase OafA/YrhL